MCRIAGFVHEYFGCSLVSLKLFSWPSFLIPQWIKTNAVRVKKTCNKKHIMFSPFICVYPPFLARGKTQLKTNGAWPIFQSLRLVSCLQETHHALKPLCKHLPFLSLEKGDAGLQSREMQVQTSPGVQNYTGFCLKFHKVDPTELEKSTFSLEVLVSPYRVSLSLPWCFSE